MAMMGHREKLRGGDEWDVVQKVPLCIFDHPRVKHDIKKHMSRRYRRLVRLNCWRWRIRKWNLARYKWESGSGQYGTCSIG